MYPGRDRTHAYDQEKTDGTRGRRRGAHCGRTVLLPGRLISPPTGATTPSRPPEQNLRHNRFQACHEGVFCLGKVGRTVCTFVKDTATMMLRGIGRMRLQDSRVARWALDL